MGNELRIYDYYTKGATSTVATGYYIDGATVQSTGSGWPFTNNERYEWTPDGVHQFFGWMVEDVNAEELFTPSFNKETKSLTIPQTTLTQSSAQFDFMYSKIEERNLNVEDPYFGEVPLEFYHLFTAFKVTVGNSSSNEVKLKSVKITGLKSTQSATLNYGTPIEGLPSVTYTPASSTGEFTYTLDNELSLDKDPKTGKANIYDISDGYKLMWPHTKANFAGAKIIVTYDYKESGQTVWNTNGYTEIDMANLSEWIPGEKHVVALMFKDKEIVLTCNVEPWNVVEEMIDFSNQISVSKPITWEAKTVQYVNEQAGEVILYSDNAIVATCNFHIDTPQGATWTASLIPIEGNVDAFKIVEDTKYGAVGVDSQVKIRVTNDDPITPRHVVKLRITVQTADGRTIIGDLMPKATIESVTEYKLIQNMING